MIVNLHKYSKCLSGNADFKEHNHASSNGLIMCLIESFQMTSKSNVVIFKSRRFGHVSCSGSACKSSWILGLPAVRKIYQPLQHGDIILAEKVALAWAQQGFRPLSADFLSYWHLAESRQQFIQFWKATFLWCFFLWELWWPNLHNLDTSSFLLMDFSQKLNINNRNFAQVWEIDQ